MPNPVLRKIWHVPLHHDRVQLDLCRLFLSSKLVTHSLFFILSHSEPAFVSLQALVATFGLGLSFRELRYGVKDRESTVSPPPSTSMELARVNPAEPSEVEDL